MKETHPNDPNCKTSLHIPLSLDQGPLTWLTLALLGYGRLHELECLVDIHKEHEQTQSGYYERHLRWQRCVTVCLSLKRSTFTAETRD